MLRVYAAWTRCLWEADADRPGLAMHVPMTTTALTVSAQQGERVAERVGFEPTEALREISNLLKTLDKSSPQNP